MTSDKNDAATRAFFAEHNYFGYAAEFVHFFTQDAPEHTTARFISKKNTTCNFTERQRRLVLLNGKARNA